MEQYVVLCEMLLNIQKLTVPKQSVLQIVCYIHILQ